MSIVLAALALCHGPGAYAQSAGLVAAYSFDEASGTVLVDSSGNANNGTLVNGASWSTTARFGTAVNFDGVNDRIDIADSNTLDLVSAMTLEAWVRPAANSGYRTVVLKEVPGELSYSLYAADSDHGTRPSGWVRVAQPSSFADGTGSLPLNAFTHLAVTYNGTALVLYVNGVPARSVAVQGSIQNSSMGVHIGGNTVWGEYFQGQIDEVRIYNRALSQSEIQTDMVTPIGSGSFQQDSSAPSVSLTGPASGATVSGAVTLTADASDNVGVAGVQFRVDGAAVGAEDTAAPYSVTWDSRTVGNGSHSITAVARDAAGNSAVSAARSITISNGTGDRQPPAISLTAPTGGSTVSGSIWLTANASDNVGVAGVQFRVDGVNLGTEDTFPDYRRAWDTTTASNGTHSLTAVARDAAGNVATSAAITVTVNNADTVAPTVSFTNPASGATVSGTVAVSASASDNVGVVGVQFRLDGNNLGTEDTTSPYSVSWATTGTANGTHQLSAIARDASGRTATATRSVTVSNTAGMALTIDGSQTFQTIDGFGISANSLSWNNGELRPAIDKLVDEGGSTIWRVVFDMADWEATNDDSDPNNFNWNYYNTVYSSAKFEKLWATLAYLNQKGITGSLMLNFMGRGPTWMGGADLPTTMEDEWVETVASVAWYARNNRNIQFGLFAPNNEPDWDGIEGIRMDRWQYTRVMAKLARRLDAIGLGDLRLIGPDTAAVAAGVNDYMTSLMSEPAVMAKLDHWALHNYSGDSGGANNAIRNSAYPAKNFWMSELSTFADALTLLSQGPSAIVMWEGYDSVYNHAIIAGRGSNPPNDAGNGPALLSYNTSTRTYAPRKAFYEFAQLFKFVPAGSVRVAATESSSSVTAYAFQHPVTGRVTIVGRNTGSSNVTFAGQLLNLPAVSAFESYRTNASEDMVRGSDVAVTNGAFTLVAPASSVFTLTYAGTPDSVPPTLSVTAPQNGATVSGTVAVSSGTASDNVGVQGVQFELDGALLGVEDVTAPYGVQWNTSRVANGNHVLTAVARDGRGNVTRSSPVTVTVSN